MFSPTFPFAFQPQHIHGLSFLCIIMQTRMVEALRHRGYFHENPSLPWKHSSSRRSAAGNRFLRSCSFRIHGQPVFSHFEFLKQVADRVAKALRLVSARRRDLPKDSSSLVGRSHGASTVDSHRTAAVEDCIEFIHSSFSRSNSSTTTLQQDSMHTL